MAAVPLLLACLLAVGPLGSVALFEDQAGTFDWYKQYVGHITSSFFHTSKPRVYVGTQQGLVAALNLRDGSIAWRKFMGDHEQLLGTMLIDAPGLALSLSQSSNGAVLRAWDQTEGAMKWETSLGPLESSSYSMAALRRMESAPLYAAVLVGGKIQTVNAMTGTIVQVQPMSKQLAGSQTLHLSASENAAIAAGYTPGASDVYFATLSTEGVQESSVSAGVPLSAISAAGAAGVAVLSSDLKSICIASAASASASCKPLASVAPELPAAFASAQLQATSQGFLLVSTDAAAPGAVLLKASGGDLTAVRTFKGAVVASAPAAADGGREYVAVAEVKSDGAVLLRVASASSGEVVHEEGPVKGSSSHDKLAPGSNKPELKSLTLGTFLKKDKKDGFRFLLVWSDERVALLQQATTVWARDEALAGVQRALFTDLPAPPSMTGGASAVKEEGDQFSKFLRMQLLSAKIQFKLATPEEGRDYILLRNALTDKNKPTRDANGFRKEIIALTSSGKVVALHNGDGHIMWARSYDRDAAQQQLLAWRTFHDLSHAPQVALVYPGSTATGAGAYLSVLDVHTGRELQRQELPYRVDKLIPIHNALHDGEAAADQTLFLAVTVEPSGPAVHLLPDTAAARAYFGAHYRSQYFWLQEGSTLKGFAFDASAAAPAAGATLRPTLAWQLPFHEPILSLAVRDPQEPSASSVKVLGDRSIMYRYLNPNTALVITGAAPGDAISGEDKEFMRATAHVVDTVTGRVIHSQSHPGLRGPGRALITENLAVYQLWDTNTNRFVVNSMELYDATPREFSVLDYLFNPNATQPQSSLTHMPVEVLTQTFFIRSPARSMAVTRTAMGLTSKQLLLLTESDQVYALDARFVDPRRPKRAKLTAEEMEERLIPYQDTLPLTPTGFITYNKQVLGLSGVVVIPSRLESTSLVFSHGVDLAYTRVAPAKAYDALDDDFSYALLVAALVALFAGSVVMQQFTKSSMLSNKWA